MKVPGVPFVQGRNDYPDQDGRKFGMAIHNTSNNASDSGEASYATRRTDGVSSHFYVDNNSITQSLDTRDKAGHAGSGNGNENSISWEFTGANGKSRQWWLDNIAWDRVGQVMAYLIKNDPDFKGFQVRRATTREMQINPKIRAFYGHDDMRRAWGGTTHTDPGPNFPWDKLFNSVNKYLEDDVPYSDWPEADRRALANDVAEAVAQRPNPTSKVALGTMVRQDWSARGVAQEALVEVTALRAQVAGLVTLVEQVLTAPEVELTPEALTTLTETVAEAAARGAREIGADVSQRLEAAGEALAGDVEPA